MRLKTDKKMRTRAISTVRGELRHMGKVPHRVTGKDAFAVLDDIGRGTGEIADWFRQASESSLNRWVKEWDDWARVELDNEFFEHRIRNGK